MIYKLIIKQLSMGEIEKIYNDLKKNNMKFTYDIMNHTTGFNVHTMIIDFDDKEDCITTKLKYA